MRVVAARLRAKLSARLSPDHEAGTAIIEVIFVAVVVMVPLVYLVIAVASVQNSQLAVAQAAREAGRAFATAEDTGQGRRLARAAVRIALADHELPDDADLRYVPAGAGCRAGQITPRLQAGGQFTICVIRTATLPAVPRFVSGKTITSVGMYIVHVDDYRASR